MAAGRETHDALAEFVDPPIDRAWRIVANDDLNTTIVADSPEGGGGASTEMLNVLGPRGDRDRVYRGVEVSRQGVCRREGRFGEFRPVQRHKDVSVSQGGRDASRHSQGSTTLVVGAQAAGGGAGVGIEVHPGPGRSRRSRSSPSARRTSTSSTPSKVKASRTA